MDSRSRNSELAVIVDDFRISAGGVLLDEEERKVCIIRSGGSGEYLLPKGGKEANETLVEAAQREVFEETGHENKISPEKKLLGIQFRPQIGGKAGEQKVIFWFYSKVTNLLRREGTGEEYEDFCSEWLSLEPALEKLSYEEDRVLVERAYWYLGRTPTDRLVEFSWTDRQKKGFRLLTTSSPEIVKGFAVVDSTRKRILLSLDRNTRCWNLPTEKVERLYEVFGSKLSAECSPFLFQLAVNGGVSGVVVTQWFLLEWSDAIVEDSQFFAKDEALTKLENTPAACVVESIFSKLEL